MIPLFASFAPTSIHEVNFCSPVLQKAVMDIIAGKRNTNLLLFGEPGTGKSRVAELMIEDRYPGQKPTSFIYNGGDWDDTCLTSIEGMIDLQKMKGENQNLTVINEVDLLSASGIAELRAFIDRFTDHHFVLTTNHAGKLPSSLINRCSAHQYDMEPPASVAIKIIGVIASHGYQISFPDALQLVADAKGSWRKLEDNIYSVLP